MKRGPVRKAIDALLADGEWHEYVEIRRVASQYVDPGEAARLAERLRARMRARRRSNSDGVPSRQADAWSVGAGAKVRSALNNAVRNRTIERRGRCYRASNPPRTPWSRSSRGG